MRLLPLAFRAASLISLGASALAANDGDLHPLWSHASGAGVYAVAAGPGFFARARGGEILLFRNNPALPGQEQVLASVQTPAFLWDLRVAGSTLYATGSGAAGQGMLFSVDVSQPAFPGPLHILDRTPATGRRLAVAGTRLYVAAGRAGLFVYELHPANPAIAQRVGALAAPAGSYFQGVAAHSSTPNIAIVADRGLPSPSTGGRSLLRVDATIAAATHVVAKSPAFDPRDVAISEDGQFAVLCDGAAGVGTFKTDSLAPVAAFPISSFLGTTSDVRAHRVSTQASFALIAIQGRNSDRMPPFDPEFAGSEYYVGDLGLLATGGDGGVGILDWSSTGTPANAVAAGAPMGRPVRSLATGFGSLVVAQTDIGAKILAFDLASFGTSSVPSLTVDNGNSVVGGTLAAGNPFQIGKIPGWVAGVADGGMQFLVDLASKPGHPQVVGGRGGAATIPWNKDPNGAPKQGVDLILETGTTSATGAIVSYFDHSSANPAPPKVVAELQFPGSNSIWNVAFRPKAGPMTDDLLVFSVGGFAPPTGPGYYRMGDLGPAIQGAVKSVLVQGSAPPTLAPDTGAGGIPVVWRDLAGLLSPGFGPETLYVTADENGRGWLAAFLRQGSSFGPVERTALIAFPLTASPGQVLPMKVMEVPGVAYPKATSVMSHGVPLLFVSNFWERADAGQGGGVHIFRVVPTGSALEDVSLMLLKKWSAPINLEGVPECVLTVAASASDFTAAAWREGVVRVPYNFDPSTNLLSLGASTTYDTTGLAEDVIVEGARITVADHQGGLHILDPGAPATACAGGPDGKGIVPRIDTFDVPQPGAKSFAVTLNESTAGSFAFLVGATGMTGAAADWNAWLDPSNAFLAGSAVVAGSPVPGEGVGAVRLPLAPNVPVGATIYFQWFVFPASLAGPIASTEVLRITTVAPL